MTVLPSSVPLRLDTGVSMQGVSVEAVDPVFQAKMLDMLKQTGRYCFLSSVDLYHLSAVFLLPCQLPPVLECAAVVGMTCMLLSFVHLNT